MIILDDVTSGLMRLILTITSPFIINIIQVNNKINPPNPCITIPLYRNPRAAGIFRRNVRWYWKAITMTNRNVITIHKRRDWFTFAFTFIYLCDSYRYHLSVKTSTPDWCVNVKYHLLFVYIIYIYIYLYISIFRCSLASPNWKPVSTFVFTLRRKGKGNNLISVSD